MTNKIILTPDGEAIDLTSVRRVSTVMRGSTMCTFEMYYKGLNSDTTYTFKYSNFAYSDSPDDLYSKVKNIRTEILKRMNDGEEVTEVFGGINLKKDGN